jgi:hypothetical protein
MLMTLVLLFSRVPAPVLPDAPVVIVEDQQGKVYLLIDAKPRIVLAWDGERMIRVSPANSHDITLIRAGR